MSKTAFKNLLNFHFWIFLILWYQSRLKWLKSPKNSIKSNINKNACFKAINQIIYRYTWFILTCLIQWINAFKMDILNNVKTGNQKPETDQINHEN